MAASSVTGVGTGSADKIGMKGSEHLFVGVEKLIGTRIVLSGFVTMGGATQVVNLAQNLPGTWNHTFDNSISAAGVSDSSDYIVFAQSTSGATATYVSGMTTTSGVQNFTITGNSTDVVFWMIVRHSDASVATFPTHN